MNSACGGSGSGNQETSDSRKGKRQLHRHTTQQVQLLEAYFKEIAHPNEKQRQQLSREIGLDSQQIKFWFQNKRTQIKAQNEKEDSNALREENERILYENLAMIEALKNISCPSCHGHGTHEDLMSLRTENTILKHQYEKALALFSNYMAASTSAPPGLDNFQFVPGNPGDGMGTTTPLGAEQIPGNLDNPSSSYHGYFDGSL